jgi:2-polyprenyl-6-methoxyphenol hydroxylase-like FAD-dependent oxidoreductase
MYAPAYQVVRSITIIGGGIGGLTLGVLLRRRGVPAELWEAHDYPRHRVCGEFISGRGAQLLLELLPHVQMKAVAAHTVRLFADARSSERFILPTPGLSIARWDLDNALAEAFVAAGGELITKRRWTESFEKVAIVRATGRRIEGNGRGWTGLKAHLADFKPTADLELYFSNEGYVGISRLAKGANICALVRGDFPSGDFRKDPGSVFRQLLNEEWSARFAAAEIDSRSCCAVAGISFGHSAATDECCVGDAIQMIPPFTGNGMSLAVESAFIAVEPLANYAQDRLDWPSAVRQVNTRCARAFWRRLMAAALLHKTTNRSWTRRFMLSSLRTVPGLLSLYFRSTR